MQITSGTITYGRTVNLGDYNNKKVEVQLSFSVAEGGDAAAATALASELAFEKCHDLITMAAGVKPVKLETAVAAAIPHVEPSQPAKRPPGRPPNVTKKPEPAQIESKPEPIVEPDLDTADSDFMGEAPADAAPVTDAELIAACTKRNHELGGAAGTQIKKLYFTLGVTQGASVITMPQDKRAEFVRRLADVKLLA